MNLDEMRLEMDAINEQINELFIKRMDLSADIADYKKEHGLPVLNRTREREILARISEQAGPKYAAFARILFSNLFDLSRSYQIQRIDHSSQLSQRISEALAATPAVFPKEAVVACQGVEGANSQIACDRIFQFANIMYVRTFEAVFSAVEKGLCRYGVLPIENSSHGSVNSVYDLIMNSHKFSIVRGIKIHINHCLLAKSGTKMENIKEICSHEQALGQCSRFLSANPGIKVTVAENTAAAAKMVSDSDRNDIAAIASEECAQLYSLSILSNEIQNTANNYTRFIVISKNMEIYPGSDKISIMFSVNNTPGALQRLIARFSSLSLNMTKLESRPIPGTDFQYRFYVDVDASVADPDIVNLMSDLENTIDGFAFLGAYKEI
ncbi:MAG: prephenate dehydratase [Lachnospiraceae bacterium]|nr:prephenate dehydratase [Lachnospiraceae bacterium]